MTTIEGETYQQLKERGIKFKTPRQYLDDYVYTFDIHCNDGTVWGYSSEDGVFYQY